ncbi:lipoate protein ligase C-terminal domain-containing protein [Leadbettera azotonutricia]|uniref:lipoate protein ligase C-terminal domain-containing protein n=1 Tax=Leadbettera azotonutricia TaxID=150829 RepID=UPI0002FCEF71|nr:lipoate protein ligase C-terminal domain-containing protein [Leadbettera azotonutricia]
MKVEALGKPPGCKLIRISAEVSGGLINSIEIRGDFFASPEESFEEVEKALSGTAVHDLAPAFDTLLTEKGIESFGVSGRGLAEVLSQALAAKESSPEAQDEKNG